MKPTTPDARATSDGSLRSRLSYEPRPLSFGTSGLRGLVADITDLEAYINAKGFLRYSLDTGDAKPGGVIYVACDLRPSSDSPDRSILRAVTRAVEDSGLKFVHLGRIPTPALTYYAMQKGAPSIVVTGSHIPFDRNGIKFNKSAGEVLKSDEAGILKAVAGVREEEYRRPASQSLFDERGMIKASERRELPAADDSGRKLYLQRYLDFFAGRSLKGKRVVVYQHSAVGRDLLVELLGALGAEAIPAGRSETFIPIDTEDIQEAQLATLQQLADAQAKAHGPIDALVSTDGDSDRPLVCALQDGRVRFIGGDLLGVLVAEFLGARTIAVPISANDAVDLRFGEKGIRPVKTRIGSPYVIQAMEDAKKSGAKNVVGWEANGGFLTGSDLELKGKALKALPTRDSTLPILSVFFSAAEQGKTLPQLFDTLPKRYSKAGLIDNFPVEAAKAIVARFSPPDPGVREVDFAGGNAYPGLAARKRELERFFPGSEGFGPVSKVNFIDGVRIHFANGDVAHLRPSGNAPQMRIYSNSDSQARADAIVRLGLAEPDGVLRRLERLVSAERLLQSWRSNPGPVFLEGKIQHYEWGGTDFISGLLGRRNETGEPNAELWIGAHPNAPSAARLNGASVSLRDLIAADPAGLLGAEAAARFNGELPYLYKVLDARKMLSIQAHPTKKQGEEGFARENAAGIPLNAKNRNYKDDNHKPEVHVALTEFWMLHGFRPLEEIAAALFEVPEFKDLMPDFGGRLEKAGKDDAARRQLLRELYEKVMTLPQERVDGILNPLIDRLKRSAPFAKSQREFWVLRAAEHFPLPGGRRDRGIFSIYLLNLLGLKPGQGTFQAAGALHAYLEGANMELMANSDNVLRGGLTPKHVDVPELLRTLTFESGPAEVLDGSPRSDTERVYPTPAPEFEISRIEVAPGREHSSRPGHGADTLVVLEGEAELKWGSGSTSLRRGQIAFAPYGLPYSLRSASRAVLYKATVPA